MNQSFIVEAGGYDAGIIIRDQRSYRFFAAHPPFFALEGRRFRDAAEAIRAAEKLIAAPSRRLKQFGGHR